MNDSLKKGLGFGLTSGIITTLGLISGMAWGFGDKSAVIGGIIIIAFADALSDAFGIHISEEVDRNNHHRGVWEATLFTFLFKLIFSSSFIIPFLFFNLKLGMIISFVWGLLIITIFSVFIANSRKESVMRTVFEHSLIAIMVVFLTGIIGLMIRNFFG